MSGFDWIGSYIPIQRTSLPITKAPTKTRPMEARKMIVATTRTGLNIYKNKCLKDNGRSYETTH